MSGQSWTSSSRAAMCADSASKSLSSRAQASATARGHQSVSS
ncbi:hypothetical protein [Streptomyces sp. NPDC101455]